MWKWTESPLQSPESQNKLFLVNLIGPAQTISSSSSSKPHRELKLHFRVWLYILFVSPLFFFFVSGAAHSENGSTSPGRGLGVGSKLKWIGIYYLPLLLVVSGTSGTRGRGNSWKVIQLSNPPKSLPGESLACVDQFWECSIPLKQLENPASVFLGSRWPGLEKEGAAWPSRDDSRLELSFSNVFITSSDQRVGEVGWPSGKGTR